MSTPTEQSGKTGKKAGSEVQEQNSAAAASNTLMHFVLGLALGGGLVAGMQARLWWLELLCLGGVLLYVLLRSGLTRSMQKRAAARK